jgi:hypothetical protein
LTLITSFEILKSCQNFQSNQLRTLKILRRGTFGIITSIKSDNLLMYRDLDKRNLVDFRYDTNSLSNYDK